MRLWIGCISGFGAAVTKPSRPLSDTDTDASLMGDENELGMGARGVGRRDVPGATFVGDAKRAAGP
jgi:hypothetical protein